MAKYLSNRAKRVPQSAISTDRYQYLSLSEAEPHLGYPGEKSIPLSPKYYNLVTIENAEDSDRYWQELPPATLVNGISIFDEGILVGTANSVSKINFVGAALSASSSGDISTVTVFAPGSPGQIIFNNSNEFSTDSLFVFNPVSNSLGIGTTSAQANLHIGGTLKLTESLIDYYNNVGVAGSILISTGAGVSWTDSTTATGFQRRVYNFVAIQDQTAFTIEYDQTTKVDVYLNGVHLTPSEYTLSGLDTLTLSELLDAGEIVDVITYKNAGAQGVQGTQGLQGLQGLQGVQGLQGLQGLQGTQGIQGTQGLQGNQGIQGIQGLQGLQGLQGIQGLQGTQGTQGIQGIQGLQGLQGFSGVQGVDGTQGTQGRQGIQGLIGAGTQGIQGLTGTGTQGTQGRQGTLGSQGTDGAGSESFVSGTTLLFYQASAPTGWTKSTTHNNKALRVVSGTGGGSGGSTAFTTVFSATRTPSGNISGGGISAHTLATSEMPSHNHSYSRAQSPGGGQDQAGSGSGDAVNQQNQNTGSRGGSGSHTHGYTDPSFAGSPMNFAVQYIDVIIASKN